ncbi:hypothetical protein A3K64_03545 [Candidatus Micrarchaeota archaeon RBG_16_36_9]|nr:MAG: hypothetical protein A3K64_03545 [Candidatus Micrarchaeota archaeon RBG_16_36_9]
MGTVVKNDFAKIEVGESANFKVLFWNIENESYKVELYKKEAPENWVIIVEPNNFNLNASEGKEYIKLPYENDYVKATLVDIIVKPYSVNPGKYNVVLVARSFFPQNGISFSQERLFKFVVEIENPLFFENSKKQNQDINQNKENQDISEINLIRGQENFNSNYFYTISIILILLLSFLIYKYS